MKKILLKIGFGLLLLSVLGAGCEEDLKTTCIEGNVIGYEECLKATLIEVKNVDNMGKTITYYDPEIGDSIYNNVIKSPDIYPKGKIYFTYRTYNVTIFVITDYSQSNCPQEK